MNSVFDQIKDKYQNLGENPETHLKGLLQAKPMNYWDYVETETLLSLQKPRTNFKDEEIFIMYHQVTELFLKMLLHELKQLTGAPEVDEAIWIDKLNRMNRYVHMLINSFDIMKGGMSYDDYNTFRHTLAPASGFQSVQFRYIELHCTPLENLVNAKGKERLPQNPTFDDLFDNLYWKDAGYNRETGEKTLTLSQFEEKYEEELIYLAKKMRGQSLQEKYHQIESPSPALKEAMAEFDKLYNLEWPNVHLKTAAHYLDKKGETQAATGGSEWKKYLHPKHQERKFFPSLWQE